MGARNVRDTRVYKLAFELAMEIFEISKTFPKEERYSLTDQIRKSSCSVVLGYLRLTEKRDIPLISCRK